MRCPSCGGENPAGTKFCGECGTPVENRCPQCGFENLPLTKFCRACGTSLGVSGKRRKAPSAPRAGRRGKRAVISDSPPPLSYTPLHLAERILAEQAAMEARGASAGERKTITALFADLAGFTALARDLDPEDTRRIIDPALHLMMDAVHRYEGYVAQSLGDGIFALFGAPIAHEDHPQRALYAALRMQDELRRYADKVRVEKGVPLQMRVGINTGEVVVRSIRKDDLHTDYVPVGHSTNIASRLEGLANPGAIVVSEQTYRLTEGYFEFKALGAVQVKGLDEPVNVYEVVGVGPLRTKLQVAARRGLVRFVGRQSELAHVQKALEHTKAGHGQIVGVMGEPGVGKSRLFYEFKLVSQKGCVVLETFSVSHGKAYAYLPLIELLKNYFHITLQDDERARREKVGGKVLMLDRTLEDTLPYLFFLLGIADPTSSLQQMDHQIRRRRTFEAIKRLLVRESLNQPLILIFEDLHWLDTETQAFLSVLSESVATARILLLVNYRPEYRHEWGSKTFYTQLRLLLSLAHRQQDPALLLEAHHGFWSTARSRGELAVARVHAEQGLALYDSQHHRAHAFLYVGHDPGVCGWSELALALWLQGYPAQALQSRDKALALAHELTHPFSLAFALYFAAVLHQLRQEGQAAQEQAEAVITLSAEQGFSYWLALGTILRGWALAEQGQGEEGIAQMRQGLAAYRATGAETLRPYYLALLAEAQGKMAQTEEGFTLLAEALAHVDKTGERMYEAELYRLKGKLTLKQFGVRSPECGVSSTQHLAPSTQEAEACFHKAIEIARKQQAKSLELRAAMSLSRLWQQHGKKAEARQMLAEIYGWFTEGFNTRDLQETKALLEALQG